MNWKMHQSSANFGPKCSPGIQNVLQQDLLNVNLRNVFNFYDQGYVFLEKNISLLISISINKYKYKCPNLKCS